MKNKSLIYVRNFNVDIKKWATDSTETLWIIEETIYTFENHNVSCIRKSILTEDLENIEITLKDTEAKRVKNNFENTFQEKTGELQGLLALKDDENR